MVLFRKIVFYFFILLYLVLCPFTILYALGIIYRPGIEGEGSGGRIVKTGLIYLATTPPRASIYFGESRYKEATPTVIRDLMPGNYSVKIALDGYKTWVRSIPVEKEKASAFDHILLLPKQFRIETLTEFPVTITFCIPGTNFFIFRKSEKLSDYWVFNWKNSETKPLWANSPNEATIERYFTSPQSTFVLLEVKQAGMKRYLWMDIDSGDEQNIIELSQFFPQNPESVFWSFRNPETLFVLSQGEIIRVDVKEEAVRPHYLENVRGFGVYGDTSYYISNEYLFLKKQFSNWKSEVLYEDTELLSFLFGGQTFSQISFITPEIILFLSEKGSLFSNLLPYQLVKEGIEGWEPGQDKKKVLVWTSEKIGVLDFEKRKERGKIFEEGPRVNWGLQNERKIEQAFWINKDSYVLYRQENKIYLLELEFYGVPERQLLLEVKPDTSIFYTDETGKLYYIDKVTSQLKTIELVPKREIMTSPFIHRQEMVKHHTLEK